MLRWEEEATTLGNFRSAFMALVDRQGNVDHYGGWIKVIDADGHALAERIDPKDFNDYIGEAVEPWSYLKTTFWKPMGYPDGIYRVGPLARLNVAEKTGTPRADEELEKFRWRVGRVASSSFHYHYARLIDTLHAIEKIEQLLRGPDITGAHTRSVAGINRNEGIGVSEAPRGTLMHHYKVDDDGLVEWVNLVIATGHNNMAMNRAVLQVARHYVKGDRLEEAMLNRVESVIRCYDPCLSCSTHALGQMAIKIDLLAPDGRVLSQLAR
jgi:NAD-reducing hydrogenase large subunit